MAQFHFRRDLSKLADPPAVIQASGVTHQQNNRRALINATIKIRRSGRYVFAGGCVTRPDAEGYVQFAQGHFATVEIVGDAGDVIPVCTMFEVPANTMWAECGIWASEQDVPSGYSLKAGCNYGCLVVALIAVLGWLLMHAHR